MRGMRNIRVVEYDPAWVEAFQSEAERLSTSQSAINRIAEAGVTQGCNPPANDRFCPDRNLIRSQKVADHARHTIQEFLLASHRRCGFAHAVRKQPGLPQDEFVDNIPFAG